MTVMLYVSQFSGVVKSLLTWEVSCTYMYVHVNTQCIRQNGVISFLDFE